jgi:hypothetical protein
MLNNQDIEFICRECGHKFGRPERVGAGHLATFHLGHCDICGENKPVSEPRDFGYLKTNWKETNTQS